MRDIRYRALIIMILTDEQQIFYLIFIIYF